MLKLTTYDGRPLYIKTLHLKCLYLSRGGLGWLVWLSLGNTDTTFLLSEHETRLEAERFLDGYVQTIKKYQQK